MSHWMAVVLLKGDWSEYAHTIGLPTWADAAAPCPFCFATKKNMLDMTGLSVFGTGHSNKLVRCYELACGSCDRHVDVDTASHKVLFQR